MSNKRNGFQSTRPIMDIVIFYSFQKCILDIWTFDHLMRINHFMNTTEMIATSYTTKQYIRKNSSVEVKTTRKKTKENCTND